MTRHVIDFTGQEPGRYFAANDQPGDRNDPARHRQCVADWTDLMLASRRMTRAARLRRAVVRGAVWGTLGTGAAITAYYLWRMLT